MIDIEGPPELVQQFRWVSCRHKSSAWHLIDMVWLCGSPIPVGRRGVFYPGTRSKFFYLPSRRLERGGRGSHPVIPSSLLHQKMLSTLLEPTIYLLFKWIWWVYFILLQRKAVPDTSTRCRGLVWNESSWRGRRPGQSSSPSGDFSQPTRKAEASFFQTLFQFWLFSLINEISVWDLLSRVEVYPDRLQIRVK